MRSHYSIHYCQHISLVSGQCSVHCSHKWHDKILVDLQLHCIYIKYIGEGESKGEGEGEGEREGE